MHKNLQLLVSSLGESALFALGCAVAALVGSILIGVPFLDGLGFVLLVVSAGLMLIGGALSFVTPGKVKIFNLFAWRKIDVKPEDYAKSENRAALFCITGVLLFAYSLVLASILA